MRCYRRVVRGFFRIAMVSALGAAGCNQLLGLDAPGTGGGGGDAADGPAIDAPGGDAPDGDAPDALDAPGGPGDALDAAIDGPDAGPCSNFGGQPDEDNDGRRDDCDNCPHIAQSPLLQPDSDHDGVGDECDPYAGRPDRLVLFAGFNNGSPAGMQYFQSGLGAWSVINGQLRLVGSQPDQHYMARLDVDLQDVTVFAQITVPGPLTIPANPTNRGIGVWADVDPDDVPGYFPTGIVLENVESYTPVGVSRFAHVVGINTGESAMMPGDGLFVAGRPYLFRLTCMPALGRCLGMASYSNGGVAIHLNPATTRVGSIGLRWYGVDANVDYLAVYAPAAN